MKIGILCKLTDGVFGVKPAYIELFERYGDIELINSISTNVNTTIDTLVLPGGPDVIYNTKKPMSVKQGNPSAHFEWFDKIMLAKYWSLAASGNLNIIGICRGLQTVNNFLGGDITPHKTYPFSSEWRGQPVEEIEFVVEAEEHGIPADQLPDEDSEEGIVINSLHHQGITQKQLSDQLVAVAVSKYFNNVEIAVNKKGFFLGFQYHPEEMEYDPISDHFLGRLLSRKTLLNSSVESKYSLKNKSVSHHVERFSPEMTWNPISTTELPTTDLSTNKAKAK